MFKLKQVVLSYPPSVACKTHSENNHLDLPGEGAVVVSTQINGTGSGSLVFKELSRTPQ